jgi:hypothetical protein
VTIATPQALPATPEPADSDTIAKAREAVRHRINEDMEPGPKADPQEIAQARESVRQRMQSITYAEPTSTAGNSPALNFPPLEGPPLPISSSQHQRLYELLQRYKADQVTPEQYQAERAKILAGK